MEVGYSAFGRLWDVDKIHMDWEMGLKVPSEVAKTVDRQMVDIH
jgi:hypothetical protein